MVFVSPDRIQHCLLEYVHPGHPDHAGAVQTPVADRVVDVYRLLDRELGDAARANRRRRSGAADVRPRPPAGHARAQHEPRARARWACCAWGAGRRWCRCWHGAASARSRASPTTGSACTARSPSPPPPIDWAHTTAYTSVTSTGEGVSIALAGREPEGTVAKDDYERVRDEVSRALLGFVDPATGRHPIAKVLRKEEVLHGAVPRPRARPAARAGAALQPHARPAGGRAGRLAVRRPPARGRLRRPPARASRAGPGEEISLADFAGWITGALGVERPAGGRAGQPAPSRSASSPTTRSARSRSACAASATWSSRSTVTGPQARRPRAGERMIRQEGGSPRATIARPDRRAAGASPRPSTSQKPGIARTVRARSEHSCEVLSTRSTATDRRRVRNTTDVKRSRI